MIATRDYVSNPVDDVAGDAMFDFFALLFLTTNLPLARQPIRSWSFCSAETNHSSNTLTACINLTDLSVIQVK
jgi:hypothetical protein